MPSYQEIKTILGLKPNTGGHSVESAAIRALCIGGNDLLDALKHVNSLHEDLNNRDLTGARQARDALNALREIRALNVQFIRSLPPDKFQELLARARNRLGTSP